jgi:hypothetical protein
MASPYKALKLATGATTALDLAFTFTSCFIEDVYSILYS